MCFVKIFLFFPFVQTMSKLVNQAESEQSFLHQLLRYCASNKVIAQKSNDL